MKTKEQKKKVWVLCLTKPLRFGCIGVLAFLRNITKTCILAHADFMQEYFDNVHSITRIYFSATSDLPVDYMILTNLLANRSSIFTNLGFTITRLVFFVYTQFIVNILILGLPIQITAISNCFEIWKVGNFGIKKIQNTILHSCL